MRRGCVLFVAVLAFVTTSHVFAQDAGSGPEWFSLPEVTAESWELIYSPLDPLRFRLVQKDLRNASEVKRVLLAFPKPSSAYNTAVERITTYFISRNYPVEFTAINFQGDREAGNEMIREIELGGYDLVFSVGSTSTSFVSDNADKISVPVVSVTSKDPVLLGLIDDYDSGSGTNFAYTSLNIPISVQIAYLYELRPNLENIGIMYARNNLSAYETQVVPLRDELQSLGVNVYEVVVEDQGNSKAELARKIPPVVDSIRENDPLYANSAFWITGSTSVFREIETINNYTESVPVISVVTDVVKPGPSSAAISIGVGFRSNADVAAFYAYEILTDSIDPGALPVGIVSPPDISINFLVTRRIGLRIPFSFFETASTIYGFDGEIKRRNGLTVAADGTQ